ncbi:MAG: site-specific integrase [Bacteroidales bacterium]|nr:site-specific integrase [Bacteroidales bacterium]
MATIRPTIIHSKTLKDGRIKIQVAIAHNNQTRYLTTDIAIDSPKEFKNGTIVKRADASYLNTKLRKIVQQYQEAFDEVPGAEGMTCTDLIEYIRKTGSKKCITLQAVFDEYIALSDISDGTKRTYGIAFATLSKCISPNTILENLTPSAILALDKKLREYKRRNCKLGPAAIRNYMTTLSLLVKYAVRCGYVSYKIDPFASYTPPKKPIRDSWLTIEEIRKIRDYKPRLASVALCRDFFMLSYYLGGINLVDLLQIDFTNMSRIKYSRQKVSRKTDSKVEFSIPDEAKPIIKKYKARNGKLNAQVGIYSLTHDFCFTHMPLLAEEAGIGKKVIYYSARKSFAQHALELKVETPIIDYILGHSLGAAKGILYHYIVVTPKMATEAVRKVLDNLLGDVKNNP